MTETGPTRPSGTDPLNASRTFHDHLQRVNRLRAGLYVLDQWLATCTDHPLNELDSECVHTLVSATADLAHQVYQGASECEAAYNGLWWGLKERDGAFAAGDNRR